MSKKLDKLTKVKNKCINMDAIEKYVDEYQIQTKNTVKSIVEMGLTVKKIHDGVVSGSLDENHLDYFCMRVGLNKAGSSFRKLCCIGRHADKFLTYIDKLPSASSVLYEIATLDPDVFEKLINDNSIHPYVTLSEIKELANKVPNSTIVGNPVDTLEIKVKFDINKISNESLKMIVDMYDFLETQEGAVIVFSQEKFQKLHDFRELQFKVS